MSLLPHRNDCFAMKHTCLVLLLLLGVFEIFAQCALETNRVKIKKKIEQLSQLVDKLRCGDNRIQDAVTKAPLEVVSVETFPAKNEVCGKPFVPDRDSKKLVFCNFAAKSNTPKKMKITDLDYNLCTHVVLFGYAVKTDQLGAKMKETLTEEFGNIVTVLKSKKIPVILAIGSGDGFYPEWYSKMANKDDSRETFVSTVLDIVFKYDLSGLYVNWDYPVFWWNDINKRHPEDKDNHLRLMKQLSDKLSEKGKVLIAAGSSTVTYSFMYDLEKLKNIVDFWFCDFFHYEGSWSMTTLIATSRKRIDDSIRGYGKTIPYEKMVIGLPAYNVPVKIADKSKPGIGAAVHRTDKEGKLFHNFFVLCEEVSRGGVKIVHNETGRVNSWAAKGANWVSYESSTEIFYKAEILKQYNVAGMFLHHLDFDDFDGTACNCGRFYLLRTINEALRGDGSCVPAPCP